MADDVGARGERLRAAREAKSLGVRELSRLAGLSGAGADVSRIENGKQPNPHYDKIKAMAAALEVNPEWLWSGEGPRERRAEQTVELDGDLDPTIVKVGKAIGADPRDIQAASDARSAWGTATLTEVSAKNLITSMATARVGFERDVELEELRAAAGVKPIRRGALVDVPDDDDTFGAPKPKKPTPPRG